MQVENQNPPNQEINKEILRIIELVNASDISSIKSVVSGIVNIINDPDSTVKDLKEVISIDPPLTAKVLARANSAYFSSRQKITEIDKLSYG